MCKKLFIILLLMGIGYIAYLKTYSYNIDKAVSFVEENALSRSHTCCAWFVMRAMNKGGCPIGILPAFGYSQVLPYYGFKEISKDAEFRKGDIVVFPAVKGHIYGHIAMYTGRQWVSDFKQKSFYPAKGYYGSNYKVFRFKNT